MDALKSILFVIIGAKGEHVIPFLFSFGKLVRSRALYILDVLLSKFNISLCPIFTEYIFSFGKLNEPSYLSYNKNLLILYKFINFKIFLNN